MVGRFGMPHGLAPRVRVASTRESVTALTDSENLVPMPPQPRKPGRKPLPPGQKKSKVLNFVVEPALYTAFNRVARLLGIPSATAGREAALLWLKTVEWELNERDRGKP